MTSQNAESGSDVTAKWPKVTIYTTSWCGDCRASKRFMTTHSVPFTEFDIEASPEMAEVVVKLNNGRRSVPTIVIEGGPVLVEPSDRELGQALGVA